MGLSMKVLSTKAVISVLALSVFLPGLAQESRKFRLKWLTLGNSGEDAPTSDPTGASKASQLDTLLEAAVLESASFRLKGLMLTSVAEHATSQSFRTTLTLSALSGNVASCPAGSAATVGFSTFQGVAEVPIVLSARKNPLELEDVDLSWTGRATGFNVYRSSSPEEVISPMNTITMTGACTHTDRTAIGADVFFYTVTRKD